jgi:hypothetical protein
LIVDCTYCDSRERQVGLQCQLPLGAAVGLVVCLKLGFKHLDLFSGESRPGGYLACVLVLFDVGSMGHVLGIFMMTICHILLLIELVGMLHIRGICAGLVEHLWTRVLRRIWKLVVVVLHFERSGLGFESMQY